MIRGELMKKLFEKVDSNLIKKVLFISFCLLPVLELDYLAYEVLDQFGIPLPSTIFHYLWFPLLIVFTYLILEKKKKKIFLFAAASGVICLAYFVMHHMVVKDMFDLLYLTNLYAYSLAHEFSYYLTIMIPLFFIYVIVKTKPSYQWLDSLTIVLCCLISVPIFLSNIFEFGRSTYVGMVQDNIFSWFTGGYDLYHPRELCAKFYFPEGNTIGILMFALYPLLLKVFLVSKKRWFILPLVVIHGLAMMMLGTRVATYGAILSVGAVVAVAGAVFLFKKERFSKSAISVLLALLCLFTFIFPYSPAKINQDLAAESQFSVGLIDKEEAEKINEGASELIPGTIEYNYYYIHIFLDQQLYRFLTFPDIYYTWMYPYEIDAKFYVDLVTVVPFELRADGRDFEKYFFNYKWQNLSDFQKLFGFSYSMFMNGGITLEQDFIVQKYMYGYLGFALMSLPWLALLAAIVLMGIKKIKSAFNLNVLISGVSLCAMYLSAYTSGHVMDEYLSSLFVALLIGMLLNSLFAKEESMTEK